ncbi:hypothetical protein [Vibrio lentus]|uniref:hypothetical protein n=1 Tax=Vibrio lentus TaxID=136468 RepID=UPI00247A5F96|nr:hypothetical protein [Vibrio lentus]WGS59694.1 hypothetical protein ISX51_10330 [Vibrio lentus]
MMVFRKQRGVVTLLITSVLLVGALVVTLGTYRSVFHQIKVAQNEVQGRQNHWRSEGGLECAYSIMKTDSSIHPIEQNYSACDLSMIGFSPSTSGYSRYIVSSKSDKHLLSKSIYSVSRSVGAIQARSNLKLIGANEFVPDVEGSDRCVSVRYSEQLIINGAFKTLNPTGAICNSAYKTDTGSSEYECDDSKCKKNSQWDYDLTVNGSDNTHKGDGKLIENDFVHDESLDPFESFFGNTRDNLPAIKVDYEVIVGSVSGDSGNTCQDKIKDAFAINNKVWVIGDCDLEDGGSLSESEIGNDSKILVIQDGIVAVNGANNFPGVIYHLFTSSIGTGTDLSGRWTAKVSTTANLADAELTAAQKEKLTFFSRGSFKPKGGYVFDTPGGMTVFGVALSLDFDSGHIPGGNPVAKWKKGSWNDF